MSARSARSKQVDSTLCKFIPSPYMSGKDCCVSLPRPRKAAMVINAMQCLILSIMSPECLLSTSFVDGKLELSTTFYTVQSVKPAFGGALCKAKRFLDLDQVALLLELWHRLGETGETGFSNPQVTPKPEWFHSL